MPTLKRVLKEVQAPKFTNSTNIMPNSLADYKQFLLMFSKVVDRANEVFGDPKLLRLIVRHQGYPDKQLEELADLIESLLSGSMTLLEQRLINAQQNLYYGIDGIHASEEVDEKSEKEEPPKARGRVRRKVSKASRSVTSPRTTRKTKERKNRTTSSVKGRPPRSLR